MTKPIPNAEIAAMEARAGNAWGCSGGALWHPDEYPHETAVQDVMRLAAELRAARTALREASEFLEHSGNQRAVLSGKFITPSARYDWFNRVKKAVHVCQPDGETG